MAKAKKTQPKKDEPKKVAAKKTAQKKTNARKRVVRRKTITENTETPQRALNTGITENTEASRKALSTAITENTEPAKIVTQNSAITVQQPVKTKTNLWLAIAATMVAIVGLWAWSLQLRFDRLQNTDFNLLSGSNINALYNDLENSWSHVQTGADEFQKQYAARTGGTPTTNTASTDSASSNDNSNQTKLENLFSDLN